MHYYEVAPNQIIRSQSDWFTYASETALSVGSLVVIEVGKKSLTGIVMRSVEKPAYDTKLISQIIENQPLPSQLVDTSLWLSQYYQTPLATVLQTILPRGLTKNRRPLTTVKSTISRSRTNIVFTDDQQHAISEIEQMTPGTALLHGVTGSGKTAVYIELTRRSLEAKKSAIILVPEIALTSQLVAEFEAHFGDIILTHSRQTEAQRHSAWKEALNSDRPRVIIGPRSALFMPLKSIGTIVIDECHEPSFKQEQAPRYSALRTASILAGHHQAKLILGSATPTVSDYYVADKSNRPIITMNKRAQAGAVAPTVSIIDMTKRSNFKNHRFLSKDLLAKIDSSLASKQQVLLFHNRRGSASTTLCESCGWQAMCPNCFVPLTLHADKHHLRCHICNYQDHVPTSCPECQSVDVIHKGIGTKLIETEIRRLYPDATIGRFDGDTDSDLTVDKQYQQLYDGDIDIIIGTQVIAKGLDLPNLRTVGVIQADSGLSLPDYSSPERTFQLLAQVVGRVGRSHHETDVVVQSYQPNHPAVQYGLGQRYKEFYDYSLIDRQRGYFPPFSHLLKLTCIYKTEAAAIRNAQNFTKQLRQLVPKTVQLLGPTPSFYERQGDTYRWQITIKSSQRSDFTDILAYLPPKNWQYELDPISLL